RADRGGGRPSRPRRRPADRAHGGPPRLPDPADDAGADRQGQVAGTPHAASPAMKHNELEHFAAAATRWTGSTPAFIAAVGIIIVWLITGPIFHFSDTWQLVINTGTTIITFLMVFLIQRAQNIVSLAMPV